MSVAGPLLAGLIFTRLICLTYCVLSGYVLFFLLFSSLISASFVLLFLQYLIESVFLLLLSTMMGFAHSSDATYMLYQTFPDNRNGEKAEILRVLTNVI